jgi:hypothetical protein
MAALIDLNIAGRTYQVACREGEEENLRAAARLVDGKSREALGGLGTSFQSQVFCAANTAFGYCGRPRLPLYRPSAMNRSPFSRSR